MRVILMVSSNRLSLHMCATAVHSQQLLKIQWIHSSPSNLPKNTKPISAYLSAILCLCIETYISRHTYILALALVFFYWTKTKTEDSLPFSHCVHTEIVLYDLIYWCLGLLSNLSKLAHHVHSFIEWNWYGFHYWIVYLAHHNSVGAPDTKIKETKQWINSNCCSSRFVYIHIACDYCLPCACFEW